MASVQPKIKSKVRCVDGEIGEIVHVIADPISLEVSHIVVRANGTQRQVPVATIAAVQDDSVELLCNAAQVPGFPEHRPEDFLTSKQVEIPHLENRVHVEPGDLLAEEPQAYCPLQQDQGQLRAPPGGPLPDWRAHGAARRLQESPLRVAVLDRERLQPGRLDVPHPAQRRPHRASQGDTDMKLNVLIAGLCISVAPVVSGQAFAQTTQTETKYVTVDGEVVRYEAGRVIVIRGADNKEITYTLSPSIVVPAEVKVGRRVTLFSELDKDGATQLVSRVTTTSITSEGDVKRTTEDTRHLPSGATTRTTTTTVSGKVEAYEAGKTLTITRYDGSKVTYVINEKSKVPPDLVIGRTVSILPLTTTGTGEPVAQTITYITTTKTETIPER